MKLTIQREKDHPPPGMAAPSTPIRPEEKTFLLNDAVFYEVLFALGVSNHDSTDYCVWEHLNLSRMGHARTLLYFFENPKDNPKFKDDLVSEHFGFAAAAVNISEHDRVRFNKDLFHLSVKRTRHTATTKPWSNTVLQRIHERSVAFVEHLLKDDSGRDFVVEAAKWKELSRFLNDGRELEISRRFMADGTDSGWILSTGRKLSLGLSELTVLNLK